MKETKPRFVKQILVLLGAAAAIVMLSGCTHSGHRSGGHHPFMRGGYGGGCQQLFPEPIDMAGDDAAGAPPAGVTILGGER